MIFPPRLRHWLTLGLIIMAGVSRTTAADSMLAPNQAIDLQAKVARPTISPRGDYLYWLNQSDGKLQRAALADNRLDEHALDVAPGARDFCLSPDGASAYIAATTNDYSPYRSDAEQRGVIQTVNLKDMTVTEDFGVPIDLFEIVCDAAGFLYATPGSGQWVKIHKISPRQHSVLFGFGQIYGKSNLRITPARGRLYLGSNGISPGNISAVTIPADAASAAAASPYNSPYHGDYPLGGPFDITPDGRFIVNRSGIVVRLGTAKGTDMLFVTKVEPNRAAACDPASGRFWLALADGRLLTYKYPAFELERTEFLTSPGESLAYDPAHTTLWVAWARETGGIGGLDAYNLQSPAAYPNDITKAREKGSRRVQAATPAARPAAGPAEPVRPGPDRNAGLTAIHHDNTVLALLAICVMCFLGTIFFSRRVPAESPLRTPGTDADDPRNWPLPGEIKFVGWFGWFQVLVVAIVVWFLGAPGNEEQAVVFARVLMIAAAILGGLAWGILRGNKICYVAYALFLLLGVIASASQGSSPGYITVILLFVVIHYGRKYWDHLG